MSDFYEAWWWLYHHPINKYVHNNHVNTQGMYQLDIYIARVNPETENIEDDASLNTHTRVWLEFGPFVNYTEDWPDLEDMYQRAHDPRLDCGGDTFEGAILNLANLVRQYYGDYTDES